MLWLPGKPRGSDPPELVLIPGAVLPQLHTLAQAMQGCRDVRAFKVRMCVSLHGRLHELVREHIGLTPGSCFNLTGTAAGRQSRGRSCNQE